MTCIFQSLPYPQASSALKDVLVIEGRKVPFLEGEADESIALYSIIVLCLSFPVDPLRRRAQGPYSNLCF
jgi:hypothetical protein